jgi:hypothetical protein
MKKLIIYGYYVGMILLSFFMFHVGVWFENKNGDVLYETDEKYMSTAEANQRGFDDPKYKYFDQLDIKYTFIKKPFGYEIDEELVGLRTMQTSRRP